MEMTNPLLRLLRFTAEAIPPGWCQARHLRLVG